MESGPKLRVFISWAGEQAETLGKGFHELLGDAVNGIDVFMSARDIDKGTVWNEVLTENLRESPCAIVCLTPESLRNSWVAFETGAISSAAGGPEQAKARIWTYLLGLEKKDLLLTPFSPYQATSATEQETFSMIESMNKLSPDQLKADALKRRFESLFWPAFSNVISAAKKAATDEKGTPPGALELVPEILLTVRSMQQDIKNLVSREGAAAAEDLHLDGALRAIAAVGAYDPKMSLSSKLAEAFADERVPKQPKGILARAAGRRYKPLRGLGDSAGSTSNEPASKESAPPSDAGPEAKF